MNKNNKIITVGFTTIIAVISLLSIISPRKIYSSTENRYLQKAPEFSIKSLLDGSFGEKYELYLSDQFFLRNDWIGLKVIFERMQLKTSINNVYIGKKEYLIEKFDREDIEGDRLQLNLSKVSGFVNMMCEKLGDEHIRVMPVPSASEILTDKLPISAAPYCQRNVYEKFKEILPDNVLIDVFSVLEKHTTENIYYRTDHHWTALGAYYGYMAWAESVETDFKDIKTYNREIINSEFLGTIHSKLNIPVRPDTMEIYELGKPNCQVYFDGSLNSNDTLYYTSHLETKDKYAYYLDGNHGLVEIKNKDASDIAKGKSIIIIKDSYANCIAPYYIYNYEIIYMVDLRYFNVSVSEFIGQNNIDDILLIYNIPGFATEQSIGKIR